MWRRGEARGRAGQMPSGERALWFSGDHVLGSACWRGFQGEKGGHEAPWISMLVSHKQPLRAGGRPETSDTPISPGIHSVKCGGTPGGSQTA